MQRTATLSVLGLYNYNSAIFDAIKLPEEVNRKTLVDSLVTQLSGLEILYPDINIMENLIGVWSAQRLDSWRRMAAVWTATYNPIHNFDRNEEWTQTGKGSDTSRGKTLGSGQANDHSISKIAGYDSEPLVDSASVDNSGNTSSESETENESLTENETVHRGHLFGNIGVTKTQEMIRDEINLRASDIYQIIIDEFKNRFCIMVY